MRAPLLRPKFWPGHIAMLVCVAIAVGLGLWQLGAWHQHRADAARDLAGQPPVALGRLMTGDSPFPSREVGRPVQFSGRWVGGNVYVADRHLRGTRGYWVVTAALVDGTHSAMPVVRGWSRTADLPTPVGDTEVVGWLQPTEDGSGDVDANPHDDVIPTLQVATLVEHVDADLYSGYVTGKVISGEQAAGGTPAGGRALEAVRPPSAPGVSAFTGLRNLFYAVEWWVFGLFALFIWVRWCRDSLNPPDPESAGRAVLGDNEVRARPS